MTTKAEGWRIWAVKPGERALRGIYIPEPWLAPALAAKCLDTPLHQPLDPSCTAGISAFAHLEDALQEALSMKVFGPGWARSINPTEIVLVLGVVELTGLITEVREDRFEASGGPLELRGRSATIQSLILVENWFESDRDRDRLVDALSRRYAPVHVVTAEDALPDLNQLRQLAVQLQKQGHDWLSIARTVAAEGRIPRKDLRQLSRTIRGAPFNP